jgi:hypothetical protein
MSDEHLNREYLVENTWKCSYCGHVNQGRDIKCQGCKAAKQKADVDDVNPEGPEVTDEKLRAMAQAGANWVCQFCGSQERNSDGTCKNCGVKSGEGRGESIREREIGPPPPSGSRTPRPPPSARRRWLIIGGIGLALIGLVWLFVPHEVGASVKSVHWQYQADLEQRTIVLGSGFSVPPGAFNLSCQDRVSIEKQDCNPHNCNCHKKTVDQGNGFSKVQEVCSTCYDKCDHTVTRRWCSYSTYEWRTVASQKSAGDDQDPHWPAMPALNADQRMNRHEAYTVNFEDRSSKYSFSPSTLDDFRKYRVGAKWKIKVNAAHMVTPEAPE